MFETVFLAPLETMPTLEAKMGGMDRKILNMF